MKPFDPASPETQMLARLSALREFAELKQHFEARKEEEVKSLARKTFANPEDHDRLEWEKLRAFYAGVDAVLATPVKAREVIKRKEQSQ